ncbi:PrpF domain-containing protein [Candidatus Poriferisodalis sp.]|uniref:PrpF domain-containing protein n=1 Tax=Candidatus Poriferisodalis sp. TaxID=3101277 RepID=UPI003B01DF58
MRGLAVPQRAIPCVLMRGGTSRGPFFAAEDLPSDPELRDAVLAAVMGSPTGRQIDGLGGGTTVTSKVAVVGPSSHPDADVDYLFAQVDPVWGTVDTKPTCGNMLVGVGPFAIEHGLVPAGDPTTSLAVSLGVDRRDGAVGILSGGVTRTARKLMSGTVHVPAAVWSG